MSNNQNHELTNDTENQLTQELNDENDPKYNCCTYKKFDPKCWECNSTFQKDKYIKKIDHDKNCEDCDYKKNCQTCRIEIKDTSVSWYCNNSDLYLELLAKLCLIQSFY